MRPAQITLKYLDFTGLAESTRVFTRLSPPIGRPFLKWAGGKQWAAPLLAAVIPADFTGTYYEPFLGGGASFFASSPRGAFLSDANADLVRTYLAVRDHPEALIAHLTKYKNDRVFYETMRRKRPRTDVTFAARFIYLNRTAFNGLYRVNRQGAFNVPFGRFVNPMICQADRLRSAATLLHGRTIISLDFQAAVSEATAGDFVYFDPPYITGHANNGFLKYNSRLFCWDDQIRLSCVARDLQQRGVDVVITNADHPAVSGLYGGFYEYKLERFSLIGGSLDSRRRVTETLLSSQPLLGLPTSVIDG